MSGVLINIGDYLVTRLLRITRAAVGIGQECRLITGEPNVKHQLNWPSDDDLVRATRDFIPKSPAMNLDPMIREALIQLRDFDFYLVPYRGLSVEEVQWRANDPAWIARHVMMFTSNHVFITPTYHKWFDRLDAVCRERYSTFVEASTSAKEDR